MDKARFTINEGREELWDLDEDKLYLVEGTLAEQYESIKKGMEHTTRITLTEVIIKPYDLTEKYDDLPVIAAANHINTIRKKEGLAYLGKKKDKRVVFIGSPQDYTTLGANAGILRRTLKLYVDAAPADELRNSAKRLRNLLLRQWDYDQAGARKHLSTTRKSLDRANKIIHQWKWIPWESKPYYEAVYEALEFKYTELDRLIENK